MVWYAFFVCFWKKSNAYQDFDHNTVKYSFYSLKYVFYFNKF